MTSQEELTRFPEGFSFKSPRFFLVANSDCYYIYDATDREDELRIAAKNLEVCTGLVEWRWAQFSEDPWEFVEEEIYISPTSFFPTYYRQKTGNFRMWAGPESEDIEIPGKDMI